MSETNERPARSLARKVAEIIKAVGRVPKAGHNDHFNYDFAQESDVLAAVRGEMAARNVVLWPNVVGRDVREVTGKSGGALYVTVLTVEFTFEDGDSGEKRTCVFIGEGEDNHDKGSNKAITAAEKYCLLKTFLLPTGADPDGAAPAEEVPRAAPRPAAVTNYPKRESTSAAAQPRPTPQRQPSAGNLPTTFPNFGSSKGKPLAGAKEKDLKWYAGVLRENVADPSKARYKADNAAHLAAIERMLGVHAAADADVSRDPPTGPAPFHDNEPPPPGDDDAPF